MNSYFRLKLTITMILFTLAISIAIATTDYIRLKKQAINNEWNQIQHNVEMVKYALDTSEKASFLLGENIAAKMNEGSLSLLAMYDNNPSVDTWNYEGLKKWLSLDIYIINNENTIIQSSVQNDIGLNFSSCCRKLAKALDERRATGGFFHDGFDVEQHSGMIKKYSYMATRDQQYIIQLGYSIQEEDIFQQFNFLNTIHTLIQNSPAINEINVLNLGGLSLGEDPARRKLSEDRKAAFEQTLATGQMNQLKGEWNGEPATYLYVHYSSAVDTGTTQNKVLEIIHNEYDLHVILRENKQTFIIQLVIVLIVALVLGFLISRWVAIPMHLAFHDSLTGLKNRAAYNELLDVILTANKGATALLMIDLDNFKQVNDTLGHDIGDHLLKRIAHCIRSIARRGDKAFRLGGDEFILIMPSTNKKEAEHSASLILAAIEEIQAVELAAISITASIGISLTSEHRVDRDTLRKQADMALYLSKEHGKNRYHLYTE
jgi:diguanylate cyclase (GGDEF)-like protein